MCRTVKLHTRDLSLALYTSVVLEDLIQLYIALALRRKTVILLASK